MSEQWKDVPEFEGRYQVSDQGRVFSKFAGGRVLAQFPHRDGYAQVKLCLDGKESTVFVHRLVAAAFVPNLNGLTEVDHVDLDKANNYARNLEWVDRAENMRRASNAGALQIPDNRGEKNGQSKLTECDVLAIRTLGTLQSQASLASRFGVSRRLIGMVLRRQRWAHV